jgi:hypothetical protein
MSKVLLDQTRPLKLPQHVLTSVEGTLGIWGDDTKAPKWMNKLEDRFTKTGAWTDA